MRVAIALLCLLVVAIGTTHAVAMPIVIADLAADYRGGTEGQTTTDVGLPGTLGGAWNYYSDIDHEVNGNEELLTFVNAVGDPVSNGDSGYAGNNNLQFWPDSKNFPVITDGSIFNCCTPAQSVGSGFLQVHPGDPSQEGNPILAIQYTASAELDNLVLNYQLQSAPGGSANTDYRIFQVIGGTPSIIVPTSNLTPNNVDTGLLPVEVSDMTAGDSIWFYFDSGYSTNEGFPADDATNVRLTLTQVPEPSSLLMIGSVLAVGLLRSLRNRG